VRKQITSANENNQRRQRNAQRQSRGCGRITLNRASKHRGIKYQRRAAGIEICRRAKTMRSAGGAIIASMLGGVNGNENVASMAS